MQNFISKGLKSRLESNFNVKILYLEQHNEYNGYTEEDVYNHAWYAGNEIFLGKYDDPKIEILCLFHELGHIVSNQQHIGIYPCTLYQECLAWDYGKRIIQQYSNLLNIEWNFGDYYSLECNFIRENLKSYLNSEYNDLR